MNTKKKLVISLTSLAIVLVVAIAAVGITLAALTGTINSTFKITYTAYNVSATVSATYKVGESGSEENFTGGNEGSITFLPDTETATGTLSVNDPIALDSTGDKNFVVVTYTFKNNWNEETEKSNLVVSADPTTITGGGEGIEIQYETNGTTGFEESDLSSLAPVKPGETLTVKIKFSLAKGGTKSVNLSVNLQWTLTTQKIEE